MSNAYCLGHSLCIELLKYRKETIIKAFFHTKIIKNDNYLKLIKDLEKNKIPYEFNDYLFKKESKKENCYVIFEFKRYECELDFEEFLFIEDEFSEQDLGTIIRTMVAFDFKNIYLAKKIDLFSKALIRSSVGALFQANIKFIDKQKIENELVYQSLNNYKLSDKMALKLDDKISKINQIGIILYDLYIKKHP